MLQTDAEELNGGLTGRASPRFRHNFCRIPIYPHETEAIQTKLAIDKTGDIYEQEADGVSQRVMRMPEHSIGAAPAPANAQRVCSCGGNCSDCHGNDDHERVQIKAARAVVAGQYAPPIVDEALRTPGQPLDAELRSFMEPRFGHDFSRVRVHTNSQAADSARSIGAVAYTVGPDVVFAAGQYQPHSFAGRQLIAHELTHVVQQSGGAHVVRRAVLYPAATVTREDPIRRVLRAESALALTTPTVNGRSIPLDMDAATRLIKDAFQPTGVEPKNVPTAPTGGPSPGRGSGSGSGAGSSSKAAEGSGSGAGISGSAGTTAKCGFKDFDVKISATIILPTAPSHGQWGPTFVAGSDLGGSPPAACRDKTRIEVVMKGKPDTNTFYQKITANEQEHVSDLKSASDQYLVPHYQAILALKGTGQDSNACKANLQAQLEHLPDDKIRSFLSRLLEDIQRHDVPGGHPTQEQTHLDPHCDRMEITGEPKPAPSARRTR